jgi:hypothetical protein
MGKPGTSIITSLGEELTLWKRRHYQLRKEKNDQWFSDRSHKRVSVAKKKIFYHVMH